jgi:hypothetical protein
MCLAPKGECKLIDRERLCEARRNPLQCKSCPAPYGWNDASAGNVLSYQRRLLI